MRVSVDKSIYFLPGRGGRLDRGLGAELLARGYRVVGRELVGDFQRLPFGDQVGCVAGDLTSHFWHKEAAVVANSFGAYLFLQAQALLNAFPGRVLLLSPIVGEAANEEQMMHFVPPRASQLHELIFSGRYPTPASCEIHVGEADWQSSPTHVLAIGQALNIPVTIVRAGGHRLEPDYVGRALDDWL
jgi:hypothetical protein